MAGLIIAAVLLLAALGPAAAEPVSLSVTATLAQSLVTTIGLSASTAFTVASVAINTALVAGSIGVSLLLNRRGLPPQTGPGEVKQQISVPETGEINAIGRVRLSGVLAFANTPDGLERDRLILHCAGETDAVEAHFLGGREVTVEENGDVSSPPYVRPNGSWVSIEAKAGDGTETAWPALLSNFPTLWTANHRARGIAQSLIRYYSPGIQDEKFLKLYQAGVPKYERVSREGLIYDPRDGGTRWSDNGILCCLHVARRALGLDLDDFDTDFIADEADRADALVATLTGTERRSRVSGVWSSEDNRVEIVQKVLASAGADLWVGPEDTIQIGLVDDTPTADLTLPEKHILGWTLMRGPERPQRPNMARVFYYSPERNYDLAEIPIHTFSGGVYAGPAWARIDDEIARFGEQPLDIKLEMCPSASQAQRIARRLFAEARADSGTVDTNFYGLAVWRRRYVAVEFSDLGITPVCRITQPNVDDARGRVNIPLLIVPQLDDYDATDEAPAPEAIPDLAYAGDVATPNAPDAAVVVTYPTVGGDPLSGTVETRIGGWNAVSGATSYEAGYRTYTGGLPDAWAGMNENAQYRYAYLVANLGGQTVDFRVRAFDADEDGSAWSDVFQAVPAADNTAPAAPTLLVDDDGVDATYSVIAPADVNVARVTLEIDVDGGAPVVSTEDLVRPGDTPIGGATYTLPSPTASPQTVTFTAIAYAADGTASAEATDTIVVPAI